MRARNHLPPGSSGDGHFGGCRLGPSAAETVKLFGTDVLRAGDHPTTAGLITGNSGIPLHLGTRHNGTCQGSALFYLTKLARAPFTGSITIGLLKTPAMLGHLFPTQLGKLARATAFQVTQTGSRGGQTADHRQGCLTPLGKGLTPRATELPHRALTPTELAGPSFYQLANGIDEFLFDSWHQSRRLASCKVRRLCSHRCNAWPLTATAWPPLLWIRPALCPGAAHGAMRQCSFPARAFHAHVFWMDGRRTDRRHLAAASRLWRGRRSDWLGRAAALLTHCLLAPLLLRQSPAP